MEKIKLTTNYIYKTNVLQSNNDQLIEEMINASEKFKSDEVSNIGGWQSDKLPNYNNKFPYMSQFVYNMYDDLIDYCAELNGDKKYFIANIWGNLNKKGHYNALHGHGNTDIVGCYYVQMPEDPAPIIILDGDVLHNLYFKTGDLVIFDGKLSHAVEPNLSDTDRISLAFNILKIKQTKRKKFKMAWTKREVPD